MIRRWLSVWMLFFGCVCTGTSQFVEESVAVSSIKTVQLFKKGWELSFPVILLGSDDQLMLAFDELGDNAKTYHYTLVHCNSSWEVSNLHPNEYLQGFVHQPLEDYRFSLNTTVPYVHYQAVFPNDDVRLMLSGNYIVKVYEEFDDRHPVVVKRFSVVESLVNIDAAVKYPVDPQLRKTHQQVDVRVLHPRLSINNPLHEVRLVVVQNGRTDNLVVLQKPDFIRAGELVYDHPRPLLFEAGQQYRWLDIRSTRFLSEHVARVVYSAPYYHVELQPDVLRSGTPFFFREDANGQYVVSVREYDDAAIEADYLFVHFSLPMAQPYLDGHVYLLGALGQNAFSQATRMEYQAEKMAYEQTLLLKQGFYNYQYALVPYRKTTGLLAPIEGAFVEAENDYQIFVYYKAANDYYERLVGYTVVNSRK